LPTTTRSSWLASEFKLLLRGDDRSFDHLLSAFGQPTVLSESKTTVRTHFLTKDANGDPVVKKLAKAMAGFVVDFAIPRKRMRAALASANATGSFREVTALGQEAAQLFVRTGGSGEGGELLLFMLMEKTLGHPQLLSKFSLKTSANVHVHGSDGVHGHMNDDGVLDLYWGESKLYQSSSDAIKDCFESVAPFLQPDGDDNRQQDLLLLRDQLNIEDQHVAAQLIKYFDDSEPESVRVRWNAVCLIGFDLNDYPDSLTAVHEEIQKIEVRVRRWQKSIRSRLSENGLLEVNIDVFCIPMPSVDKLRKAVDKRLGLIA